MTIAEYSRHRGITPQSVRQAILQGRITRKSDGSIDPEVADREWAENSAAVTGRAKRSAAVEVAAGEKRALTRAEAKRREAEMLDASKLGKLSFADARAFKENCDAELMWRKVLESRGEVLNREAVALEIANYHRIHRDAMLNIPARVAGQVAALTEIADIQDVISDEIRAALEELCDTLERVSERRSEDQAA